MFCGGADGFAEVWRVSFWGLEGVVRPGKATVTRTGGGFRWLSDTHGCSDIQMNY